jgi:hypothetical protein
VLVHGDSHNFRIDKPLYAEEGEEDSLILDFTRVETFGEHDVDWVRALVDTQNPEVFLPTGDHRGKCHAVASKRLWEGTR